MAVAQRHRRGNQSTRKSGREVSADQPTAGDGFALADRAGQPPSGQQRRVPAGARWPQPGRPALDAEVGTAQLPPGRKIASCHHDRDRVPNWFCRRPSADCARQGEQHAAAGEQQPGPATDAGEVPAETKHAAKLGSPRDEEGLDHVRLWTAISRVDARPGLVGPAGQADAAWAGAAVDDELEDESEDELLDADDFSAGGLDEDASALTLDLSPARLSVR